VSCPTPEEIQTLLAPGEPRDPARASAVIAHVRECPRCREALTDEIGTKLAPVTQNAARQKRKGPSNAFIFLVGLGIGLFVFGRLGARRLASPRHGDGAAVISSSR